MTKGGVDDRGGKTFDVLMKTIQMENRKNSPGKFGQMKAERDAKFSRKISRGSLKMIRLHDCDFVEEANKFLCDDVFIIEGEGLDGEEEGRSGEDGGVKRMGGGDG